MDFFHTPGHIAYEKAADRHRHNVEQRNKLIQHRHMSPAAKDTDTKQLHIFWYTLTVYEQKPFKRLKQLRPVKQ